MNTSRPVLVVTTDPMRNANYGGILQAWALCETLKKLGYAPWIYDLRSTRRWRIWYALVRLICLFAPRRLTLRWWHCWPENQSILEFARHNLRYTSSAKCAPPTEATPSHPFAAYITGSDQVWRPEIYSVTEKLLDFVPAGFTGPRIAYAASFGKDDPSMFAERLISQTAPLAQNLTAISVREESAINLAKRLWGIDAIRVADPIFLLDADEYRSRFEIPAEQPTLVTYILDPNEQAEKMISEMLSKAEKLGIEEVIHLAPRDKSCVKPVVEEWIRAIGSAKYVVTDSFHGAAFSILFSRRFAVFPNHDRGGTRFDSLFEVYAITNSHTFEHQPAITESDRLRRLQTERVLGTTYLSNALANKTRPEFLD